MIRSLTVVFDRLVATGSTAFDLVKRGVVDPAEASVGVSASIAEVNGRSEATLTFSGNHVDSESGSLVDGNYMLTVIGSQVTGTDNGVSLDGDEDGNAGGDAIIGDSEADAFFRLFGDSDGDRNVDGTDYGLFGLTFLKRSGQSGFNPLLDFENDGDVDGQDYGQFGLRFLQTLPF